MMFESILLESFVSSVDNQ